MADYVVGRSEGVAYPNNNLTYRQFNKDISLFNIRNCTTCKHEKLLKCNSPCNLCSLNNTKRNNNWESKT